MDGRDTWVLDFQGSLLQVRFTPRGGISPGPLEGELQTRAYARVFHEHARKFNGYKIYQEATGQYIAADFGPAELEQIEREADALAWELRKAVRPTRGVIKGFSARSRKRLIDKAARLAEDAQGVFLTLTYKENMQDHVRAKRDLDLMCRFIRYHWPDTAAIWRLEYQKRGAIHFHFIVLGRRFVPIAPIRAHWWKITGQKARVHVARLQNRRRALYYVAKYVAKLTDDGGSGGEATSNLVNEPYSENADAATSWTGRYWGVIGRRNLPLAERVLIECSGPIAPLLQLRRYARRRLRSLLRGRRRGGRIQGFTLYTRCGPGYDGLERWLLAWLRLIMVGDYEKIEINVLEGLERLSSVLQTSLLQ